MLKTIIEKELREVIGSTKFAVIFGLSALLLLIAFYVGARNYQLSRDQFEAAVAQNVKEMQGITERTYFDLKPRAILPPTPLSALVTGVSNDIGRVTEIRGQGTLMSEDSRYNDDPIYAVFRFLDLEYIFQIVLSLFAIMVAFDAINGEKENGTLSLAFSNAIPRGTYLAGKWIGNFLALSIPLLIPILLGCLILILVGIPITGEDWIKLALIIMAGMVYVGVFLSLALLVSASTYRSSDAFLFLLVTWVVLVFIWPRASVMVSGRMVDVTPIEQILEQTNRYERQLMREGMDKMHGLVPAPGRSGPDAANEIMKRMQEVTDERVEKVGLLTDQLNEQRDNQLAYQRKVALGLALVSPATSFSLFVTEIAGTSLRLKDRYQEALAAYQETFDRFLRTKTGGLTTGSGPAISIRIRQGNEEEEKDEPINVEEIPVFTFEPPGIGESLRVAYPGLILLALFGAVFFTTASVMFLRYDLR